MGPKILKKIETVIDSSIKAKRGRKSKKELMASLNMELIVKDKDKDESKTPEKKDIISLNVNEIKNVNDYIINAIDNNIYETDEIDSIIYPFAFNLLCNENKTIYIDTILET